MIARRAAALLLLLVSAPVAAAGDACPQGGDPAVGPLPGGIGPADFGAVPEVCGTTEAALRLRGALLVASSMPDYYGSIVGAATLRGRYQLAERSSLSVAADVFAYRYVNNANLASQGASAGPATLGFQQTIALGAATVSAVHARVLLPLDTARQSGIETGLELGAGIALHAGSRLVVDGGVALAAPIDIVGGQTHLRLDPIALAEAWLRLRPWVALGAGANVRVEAAPDFGLTTVAPRLSARFAIRRRFWMALLVELPVAGSDRTDLIAGLHAGFAPD
ncbi:MAG TPA: hypothetical protein VIF57_09550 [Polyangia bacterium]